MPNSRQTSVIDSPSSSRDTNRRRSSITEHSFHGIDTSRPKAESVTHVSGTICHPCLRPVRYQFNGLRARVGRPFFLRCAIGPIFGREWHDLRMKRLGSEGFAFLSVVLQSMVAIRASESNSLSDAHPNFPTCGHPNSST